jgi:hypothetical protein
MQAFAILAKNIRLTDGRLVGCICRMGKRSPHEATCQRIAAVRQGRTGSAINAISFNKLLIQQACQ